jgi:hypothetical protein
MYDPTIGRWTSEDPLGFEAGDPNLYRYVSNSPTNHADPSGLLEVDDNPDDPHIKALVPVNAKIEDFVTKAVRAAFINYRDKPLKGIKAVFDALGADATVKETKLEAYLEKNLSAKKKEIYLIPFEKSRYRKVPILSKRPTGDDNVQMLQKTPLMFWHLGNAKEAMSPVVKIRVGNKEVPTGLDKWGHFFQQGFWYFEAFQKGYTDKGIRDRFGLFLEGDPALTAKFPGKEHQIMWSWIKDHVDGLFNIFGEAPGRHGWLASGIVSYADMAANEAGYQFYKELYDNWAKWAEKPNNYKFNIDAFFKRKNIDLETLNEYKNPNKFHPYLDKWVEGPKKK